MQKLSSLTSPLVLANGVEIPGLGYGTYQTPPEDTYKVYQKHYQSVIATLTQLHYMAMKVV